MDNNVFPYSVPQKCNKTLQKKNIKLAVTKYLYETKMPLRMFLLWTCIFSVWYPGYGLPKPEQPARIPQYNVKQYWFILHSGWLIHFLLLFRSPLNNTFDDTPPNIALHNTKHYEFNLYNYFCLHNETLGFLHENTQ